MAIKVSIPARTSKVSSSLPSEASRTVSTVATGSKRTTGAKVEELANIDTETNGLEDGYTLVYDDDTGKWVAQQLSSSITLETLDGGTY